MEKELLKLRNYCLKRREKARRGFKSIIPPYESPEWLDMGMDIAFSDVIKKLDLLLKMNSVKPLDERSPTDEQNQAGVSRPNDEAKSE